MKDYSYFIITLCNADLECQELIIDNYQQAKDAADRLNRFLPKSQVHSVILEGVEGVDVGNPADENCYIELDWVRTELDY